MDSGHRHFAHHNRRTDMSESDPPSCVIPAPLSLISKKMCSASSRIVSHNVGFSFSGHINSMIDCIFCKWLQDQLRYQIIIIHPKSVQPHGNSLSCITSWIFEICTDVINFFCHCSHCFTTIQACPIISRQCQCHMTDFILSRFNCFPVDD